MADDPATKRLDDIMCAADEEYGYVGDERGPDGDEIRGFPIVDWSIGCAWGETFPVAEWKPTPRSRSKR